MILHEVTKLIQYINKVDKKSLIRQERHSLLGDDHALLLHSQLYLITLIYSVSKSHFLGIVPCGRTRSFSLQSLFMLQPCSYY